ncbi:hypothetical protein ABZ543_13280 [Streptomyces roseifaciens]
MKKPRRDRPTRTEGRRGTRAKDLRAEDIDGRGNRPKQVKVTKPYIYGASKKESRPDVPLTTWEVRERGLVEEDGQEVLRGVVERVAEGPEQVHAVLDKGEGAKVKTAMDAKFEQEHIAADRFDDPVGFELAQLAEAVDGMITSYGLQGALSGLWLEQIQGQMGRLEMFAKLQSQAASLREQAAALDGMVLALGQDQFPGAEERVRVRAVVALADLEMDELADEA